jgi:hypothetical protein
MPNFQSVVGIWSTLRSMTTNLSQPPGTVTLGWTVSVTFNQNQQLSQNYQNHQQNNHMIKMHITATAVVEFDEESPALLKQSLEAEAGLEAFEQLEAASTMDHEEYQFEVTVEEVK